ncbi:MAG: sigma-70 family RNA polymerase sigma factor [Bacteroidetes bacterium]|nr:sigma-70 family RNA polymerase sigma factor [Bacteroidota bacterium]
MTSTDSENIARAYKKERGKLLGYISNRIHDRMEAEDILQDVFYQLTVGFNDLRRIENITAWLYRVTENRIIDRFRKKKPVKADYSENISEDELGPLTLEEILPSEALNPEDEELNEMIWKIISKTLDEIPEEQKNVFVENEMEDKSFREISEETGIGINTLISRKRYAVLALRENLKGIYKQLNDK